MESLSSEREGDGALVEIISLGILKSLVSHLGRGVTQRVNGMPTIKWGSSKKVCTPNFGQGGAALFLVLRFRQTSCGYRAEFLERTES